MHLEAPTARPAACRRIADNEEIPRARVRLLIEGGVQVRVRPPRKREQLLTNGFVNQILRLLGQVLYLRGGANARVCDARLGGHGAGQGCAQRSSDTMGAGLPARLVSAGSLRDRSCECVGGGFGQWTMLRMREARASARRLRRLTPGLLPAADGRLRTSQWWFRCAWRRLGWKPFRPP